MFLAVLFTNVLARRPMWYSSSVLVYLLAKRQQNVPLAITNR